MAMTLEEKIAYIRVRGEISASADSDAVVTAFITDAEDVIMNRAYPYGYAEGTEFPAKYDLLSCKIAIYLLNKRGADGQTGHAENSITRTYGGADVPSDMLQTVVPHCGVIT